MALFNKKRMLSIKMFPAKEGDSFLISLNNQKYILIDCGYPDTFEKYIKKELSSVKGLELFVVTHYDQDHIYGALSFLKENNEKHFIQIKQIWHNAYKHIQFIKPEKGELSENDKKILTQICLSGYPNQYKSTISAVQGSTLASKILYGDYNWNFDFELKTVSCDNFQNQKSEYKIHLLSPDDNKLEKLANKWKKELAGKGFRGKITDDKIFDDAFEFLTIQERAEVLDRESKKMSEPWNLFEKLLRQSLDKDIEYFEEDLKEANGSSIAFILEYGKYKLLFLGDAHPTLIEERLKAFYKPSDFPIHFDAIKISHHGSRKNTSPSLLQLIDSENYLISTNGDKHSHPDIETLALIVKRETEFTRNLIFNYKNNIIDTINDERLESEFKYQLHYSEYNLPEIKNQICKTTELELNGNQQHIRYKAN
nr:AVAST type 1 anti-phage system MBL fold metallo-hydrolase Avs1a [uncultured Draconibacterium sp.]